MNAEELIKTVIEGAAIGYAIGLTAAVYGSGMVSSPTHKL